MTLLLLCAPTSSADRSADRRARLCSAPALVSPERIEPVPCIRRPTRRVELALNLDADAFAPQPEIVGHLGQPAWRSAVTIHDPHGEPFTLLLTWTRSFPVNTWRFSVTRFDDDAASHTPAPTASLGPKESAGTIAFNERGELLEPSEFAIVIPGDPADDTIGVDEQTVVFGFRTARGATTQYAAPFVETDIFHDGLECPERQKTLGPCGLSRRTLRMATERDAESIYVVANGSLVTEDLYRIQGYQLELASGQRDVFRSDARIPVQMTPPEPTRRVRLVFELDTATPIVDGVPELDTPSNSAVYTERFSYYDPVGRLLPSQVNLYRIAPLRWRWFAALTGGELHFDEEGVLAAVSQGGRLLGEDERPILGGGIDSVPRRDGAVELDFGIGATRLGKLNRVLEIDSDGNGAGWLNGIRLTGDAQLVGVSSSGRSYTLSKLAPAEPGERLCRFECSNGRDDDADGGRDVHGDGGCSSPLDASERSLGMVCDDGFDNDGDGRVDYRGDSGCRSPLDDDEGPANFELRVVERPRQRWGRRAEVVVAVLDRGGAPLAWIDPASVRLETPRGRLISGDSLPVASRVSRPDANCDGREDRLFRFRLARRAIADRALCLSGTIDGEISEPPATGGGLRQSLGSRPYPTRFDFKACTRRWDTSD